MKISSIILSGGRATRMGGMDKGLVKLNDKPLISHVIERLSPQVDELFINANREVEKYNGYNVPVLQDQHSGFIGPLAGFYLGLNAATHDYVLMVPCDSPLLHEDLASTLLAALLDEDADIAVAKSDGNTHPVFCLCKKSMLPSLSAFIESGERKVSTWQKSLNYIEVDFSKPNAEGVTEAFINLNTASDLEDLAALLNESPTIKQTKPIKPSKQIDQLAKLVADPTGMEDYDPNAMSVENARKYIAQFLNPVAETETLSIRACLGRVISNDILSPANVPNYDNSAMDGYAFHADSLSVADKGLTVIGTVLAGQAFEGTVNKGECVRIMTGAMLPNGTDTVVMQERTTRDGDVMHLTEAPKPTMNVRYAGEDIQLNQAVLKSGHLMKPADIGLIASLGIPGLEVFRRLKVAIFSTGDELVSLGKPLEQGQVYDSNRYTLFGMLARLGVEMIDLGAIPDDPALLKNTMLKAAEVADVVITSGGVSVGEADYMKQLLTEHGEVMFWKLAMKPGRPLAYGKIITDHNQSAHYFGLPGNPVAVMVTFYQFVREALLRIMGQAAPAQLPMFNVTCTEKIRKMTGRTEFQRGICYIDDGGDWKVKPTGAQGSAILSSMSAANCFIILDETVGNLAAGSTVKVQVLDGLV
jgi:molybdopterin molybdotransferase